MTLYISVADRYNKVYCHKIQITHWCSVDRI